MSVRPCIMIALMALAFAGLAVPALAQQAAGQAQASGNDPVGFETSLMFSEVDLRNLRQVAVALHRRQDELERIQDPDSGGASEEDILAEILRQAQEEEQADVLLPDFYLSSILYRSPEDWSVWLRTHNVTLPETDDELSRELGLDRPGEEDIPRALVLTAQQPQDAITSLRVLAITENTVTLAWKPVSVFGAFSRFKAKDEASERKAGIRNRLVRDQSVVFDQESGEFIATLSANQTFSLDMMQIVEGRYKTISEREAASRARREEAQQQRSARSRNDPRRASGQSVERQISDELLGNIRQLQNLMPQRNP